MASPRKKKNRLVVPETLRLHGRSLGVDAEAYQEVLVLYSVLWSLEPPSEELQDFYCADQETAPFWPEFRRSYLGWQEIEAEG